MKPLRGFRQSSGVAISAFAAIAGLSCLALRWRHDEQLANPQRSQNSTEARSDPNDFDGWLSFIRMIVHSNDQ
jgi:hypothetical protein